MKKIFALFFVAALALFIAGCADSSKENESGNSTDEKNENIVVYTNSNSDGRGEWLEEKAKEAGFSIDIVGAGGADLTNRLIAEKNQPIADVVFGLNSMFYETLKQQDVLMKYTPEWAGEISKGLNDPEEYYHALVKQAILLVYNSEEFTEETGPTDWLDLWENNEFHSLYETPTLLSQATPRIVVAGILTRYQDADGELGISDEGWDQIQKFFDNGTPAVEGDDFYANLADGKTPIGTMVSSVLPAKEEQYGVTAGIVHPEVGVPMIVEQVAIVNGTKKEPTAQRFIDWFGSAEVQGEFAEKFNAMPANEKASEKANEDVKALYEALEPQDIDWGFVADNVEQWAEKIELQVLK